MIQFANQPFQLKEIPADATNCEKVRIIIEWMCEEQLLPTAISQDVPVDLCCPCCGKNYIMLETEIVNAVQGYLDNTSTIENLLTILNTHESLILFINHVQEHYLDLIDNM